MLIVSSLLTFQDVAMNIGDHGVGVSNPVMDVGNDSVDIHDAVTNVRDGSTYIYCGIGLETSAITNIWYRR